MRLDLALVQTDFGLSRRKIRQAIDLGGVFVNKKRVRIASRVVNFADVVSIYIENAKESSTPKIEFSDLEVLYRDDYFLAINKPAGIPVQATRSQAVYHIEALVQQLVQSWGISTKPILVHRLDSETTGVLLIALDQTKAAFFNRLFKERLIKKSYLALCAGRCEVVQFKENSRLERPDKIGDVKVVSKGGLSAETDFLVEEKFKSVPTQLIRCHPHSGRTHQIRVHLAHRGYPVLGDKRYGGRELVASKEFLKKHSLALSHHLLHAVEINFEDELGRQVAISAGLPLSFTSVLDKLRSENLFDGALVLK